jgi:hypothetical protein
VKSEKAVTLTAVLVLCLAALAVYSILWTQAPVKYPDSNALIDMANDIRDGSLDEMRDRAVGVPLLMLVFGTGRGFFYFCLLSYLAATMLLAWCMVELGISRWLVWAATIFMLVPQHVQVAGMLMTEGPATAMLIVALVSLLAYLRRGGMALLVVTALLFGFSAYVRPTFQMLGVLVGGLLFLYRAESDRYRRAAVAVTLSAIVLVGAYVLHNRVKFGWTALTNGMGYSLGTRTTSVYDRIADPELREIVVRNRNQIFATSGHITQTWYAVRKELTEKGMDPQEVARIAQRENMRLIKISPFAYLQQVCQSFGYYFQPFLTPLLEAFGPLRYGFAVMTEAILAIFLLVQMTLWGGWITGRYVGRKDLQLELPFAWVLPTMIILYTMLISCAVDLGEPRYRVVTDPLIIFVTVYGVAVLQAFRGKFREGDTGIRTKEIAEAAVK